MKGILIQSLACEIVLHFEHYVEVRSVDANFGEKQFPEWWPTNLAMSPGLSGGMWACHWLLGSIWVLETGLPC